MASIDERVVKLTVNDREFQNAVNNVIKALDELKTALKLKDAGKGFEEIDKASKKVKFDQLNRNASDMQRNVNKATKQASSDVANMSANVQKSVSGIGRIGDRINLSGVTSAFQKVASRIQLIASDASRAIGKIGMDTSGLQNTNTAVQSLASSFSTLETIGTGALLSIGAKAVDIGKNFASQFTSGMTDGLNEYELQMNSIQTILTNTKSKGTTIDDVNVALKQLNDYADQTIYNFSQMTKNIGTFTAAGVDLDTSVSSIKGIANLAAASGSSASQAATAMYQLSQAIAAGRVSLMDWNSVVNAGMGGELFQNALKRTAENFGTDVDAIIAKYGSFRESLTEGQWLTTEVLTETLKQISGAYSEADLMAQGYSEDQAKAIVQMAQDAEDAATKITTFTKMIDTWKESIGSGWAQTWQAIFGDFTEARDFWTTLYNDNISPMVSQISDARNNLLNEAMEGSWDKLTAKIESTGFSVDDFKNKLGAIASENGQNLDQLIQKYGSFDDVMTSGALSAETITTAVKGFATDAIASMENVNNEGNAALKNLADQAKQSGSALRNLIDTGGYDSWNQLKQQIVDAGGSVEEFQKKIEVVAKESGGSLSDLLDAYGGSFDDVMAVGEFSTDQVAEALQRLSDAQNISTEYTEDQVKALRELADQADNSGSSVNDLVQTLSRKSGRQLLFESIINMVQAIIRPISAIRTAFLDVFAPSSAGVYNLVDGFNRLSSALVMSEDTIDKLTRTFRGLFSIVSIFTTLFGGVFGGAFQVVLAILEHFNIGLLDVTATIGDAATAISNFLTGGIGNAAGILADILGTIAGTALDFFNSLRQFPLIDGFVNGIISAKDAIIQYGSAIGSMDSGQIFQELSTRAIPILQDLSVILGDLWSDISADVAAKAVPAINAFVNEFTERFPILSDTISTAKRNIEGFVNSVVRYFNELLYMSPGEALGKVFSDIQRYLANFNWDSVVEGLRNLRIRIVGIFQELARELPEIGPDIIQGLINGIQSRVSDLLSSAQEFVQNFIDTVKYILGIHSPSTVMFEIGQNIVQGLFNGIESMIHGIGGLFSAVGEEISNVLGSIDWGTIGVLAIGGGLLVGLYKATDALQTFAAAAKNVTAPMGSAGKLIDSVTNAINKFTQNQTGGTKLQNAAKALKDIATAIAILAGSVAVLAQLDTGDLWMAIGALGALATILGLLSAAMVKIAGGATLKEAAKLDSLLLTLTGSFTLFAIASKIMGSIKPRGFEQALSGFIIFGMVCSAMVAVSSSFPVSKTSKVSSLLMSVAGAFMLFSIAARIAGGLKPNEFDNAARMLGGFVAMMTILMLASNFTRYDTRLKDLGNMVLKISAAFIAMAVVARIMGSMDPSAFQQGAAALILFTAVVSALMLVGSLLGKRNSLTKIGKSIEQIGIAFIAMAVAARIMAGLSPSELAQGVLAVTAFAGVIMGMMALAKIIGGTQIAKIGTSILAISGAIAIMSIIAVLLGNVKTGSLVKGIVAVAALSAIVVALVQLTKNVKGMSGGQAALLAMSASIGILAAAVALLSLIDPSKLVAPTVAIAVLMGMYALMMKAGEQCKAAMPTLIVMTASVAIFAGIIAALTLLDTGKLLGSATALSEGMLALSASFLIISKAGKVSWSTMGQLAVLLAITAGVGAVIAALAVLPIGSTLPVVASLSVMLLSLSAVLAILSKIGAGAVNALPALAVLGKVILVVGAVVTAIGGLDAMLNGAVSNFVNNGAKILEGVGEAIGGFVGGIAAGAIKAVSGSLPDLATNLSSFMTNLQPFIEGAKDLKEADVVDSVSQLATALALLSGGSFLNTITNFLSFGQGGIEDLGETLVPLAEALGDFSDNCDGIDADSMQNGVKGAKALADLLKVMPKTGGFWQVLTGHQDWRQLSTGLKGVGEAMKAFSEAVSGQNLDPAALDTSIPYMKQFIEGLNSLPKSGGAWQKIFGEQDWNQLGDGLKGVGEAMKSFSEAVSGESFNADAVNNAMPALKTFIESMNDMPKSNGKWQEIFGEQNFDPLIDGLKDLGSGLDDFNSGISGEDFDIDKVKKAANVIKTLGDTANSGAFQVFFVPENFSESTARLGEGLKKYNDSVKDLKMKPINNSMGALTKICNNVKKLAETKDILGASKGFITDANQLGVGLKQYAEEVSSIGEDRLEAMDKASTAMSKLVTMVTHIAGVPGGVYEASFGFITDANQLGVGLRQYAEEVGNISEAQFTAVDNAVTPMESLVDMISDIADKSVKKASVGFITDANQLGVGLRQYAEEVGNISEEQFTAVSNSTQPMTDLVDMISGLVDVGSVTGVSEGFITDANQLGVGLKQYANQVGQIEDMSVVASSVEPMNSLMGVVTDIGEDASFSGKTDGFITAANQLGSGLRQYAEEVVNVDASSVTNSINTLSPLSDALSGMNSEYPGVESFKNALTQLSDADLSTFNATFSANATTAETSLTNFGTALSNASSTIANSLSSISGSLNGFSFGASFIESINSAIDSVKSTMGSGGADAGRNFVLSISVTLNLMQIQAMDAMSTLCDAMIYAATQVFDNSSGKFTDSAKKLLDAFCNGLRNTDAVKTAANAVSNAAADSLKNYDKAFDSGSNLIQGFIDGINSRRKDAITAASDVGSATMAALNNSLGEKSPSRFARKSGAYLMIGLEQGIESRVDTAKQIVAQAGADLISTIDDVSYEATSSLSDTLRPTISPIMDLSTIAKSERLINPLTKQSIPFDVTSLTGITMDIVDTSRNRQNDEPPVKIDTNDLVCELRSVREHIDILGSKVDGMNTSIVMDSGALVGSMYQKMDRKLGRTAAYKKRGI